MTAAAAAAAGADAAGADAAAATAPALFTNDAEKTNDNTIDIPSADILHLLQAELVASGLHATSAALRLETGGTVGLPGLFPSSKALLLASVAEGRWGKALELLDSLDLARFRRGFLEDYHHAGAGAGGDGDGDGGDGAAGHDGPAIVTPLEAAVALAHEMTILELAEQNEVELAYATLRMCASMLDRALPATDDPNDDAGGATSSRSGDVERRVTALSSLLSSAAAADHAAGAAPLPANYYGPSNQSRQKRRDQVGKLLKRHVPEIPPQRLASLLQQSLKWQCHTGAFPTVKRLFHPPGEDEEGGDETEPLGGEDEDGEEGGKRKKKKKKRKKSSNTEERFDLVLGNVAIAHGDGRKKRKKDDGRSVMERIPSRIHQIIRLGKKSYIEAACFLPDGKGLITGSSDGFVEVWGEPIRASSASKDGGAVTGNGTNGKDSDEPHSTDIDFEKLRTSDLPYQRTDDLMMHDAAVLAMDVSRDGTLLGTTDADGTVCVWKIADGKLLRRMERAHGGSGGIGDKGAAVTCIQFSPDGSKLLTGGHDSTCREFGLLSSRMLKEFRGHTSYVNCCSYVLLPPAVAAIGGGRSSGTGGSHHHGDARCLVVVTASADGSVRIWDGRTAEPVREIAPPVPATATAAVISGSESLVASKSIHTAVPLHSPANALVVVPRCDRAYLMSYAGAVLRTYVRDDVQGSEFLAATVSASNQFLFIAADDGKCAVFDVATGKVEKIVQSFAEDCTSSGDARSGNSKSSYEMSGIISHPHRGFIGGYSNDRGQKRGILTLWK